MPKIAASFLSKIRANAKTDKLAATATPLMPKSIPSNKTDDTLIIK